MKNGSNRRRMRSFSNVNAEWIVLWLPAMLVWMVLGSLRASAQEATSVTVPITLHGVHIFVSATIQDKPVTLVLDTGAGANVLTPQAAARLQLTPGKGRASVTGAGGNGPSVSLVKIPTLGIGTSRLTDQSAYLIPLPDALPCDGLLGTPFLESWVVTIDYEHSRMILTPRQAFVPPPHASVLPMRFQKNTPHIEGTVDGYSGWFQIDTGAGDAVTLFTPFVEKNHLRGKYTPSLRMATGRGVGGVLYGDVVRLSELVLGDFHLRKPVAELSRQKQGVFAEKEVAGNLGGEVWQRFTLTLDYANKKVYLSPDRQYDAPFVGNRSGLGIDDEQGTYVVRSVLPKSPGEEAGVKVGESVLAINGVPMAQIKPWDVRDLLRGDPGTQLRLRLRSSGKAARDVTLTLRDLL